MNKWFSEGDMEIVWSKHTKPNDQCFLFSFVCAVDILRENCEFLWEGEDCENPLVYDIDESMDT